MVVPTLRELLVQQILEAAVVVLVLAEELMLAQQAVQA
jgi:hypothetical protein